MSHFICFLMQVWNNFSLYLQDILDDDDDDGISTAIPEQWNNISLYPLDF